MHNTKFLVYTDSSFKNNFGGWSAIIINGHQKEIISGKLPSYINDSGASEFYAVYKAFMFIIQNKSNVKKITFNTDHEGIPDSFRRFYRNHYIIGTKMTILLKKGILLRAKKLGIFIHANHIMGHQPVIVRTNKKKIKNLRKTDKTKSMIESMKEKKWHLLRNEKKDINLIYAQLKKGGSSKSSILNNIVDAHSKRMRKRAERSALAITRLVCNE